MKDIKINNIMIDTHFISASFKKIFSIYYCSILNYLFYAKVFLIRSLYYQYFIKMIICFNCKTEVDDLKRHWQDNQQCKKAITTVGKASSIVSDGEKICMYCGKKMPFIQAAKHGKNCLRQTSIRAQSENILTKRIKLAQFSEKQKIQNSLITEPNQKEPHKIQQNKNLQQILFNSLSPILFWKIKKWVQANYSINEQILLNIFSKYTFIIVNQLPSTIPQFKIQNLFIKGKSLKIPWDKIITKSSDILSHGLILNRIQRYCPQKKDKILTLINKYLKRYADLKIVSLFPVSKTNQQIINQRDKRPILPSNMIDVIQTFLKTNRRAFILIALDLWIIFQSGLRFPSSKDQIQQIILFRLQNKYQLNFQIKKQTKTKTQFRCIFSQTLTKALIKAKWPGFTLTKRQISRLIQFLPFSSFSIRRCYMIFLAINGQNYQKIRQLTQHKSQKSLDSYLVYFKKASLLQIKQNFKIRIPGIQSQSYQQHQRIKYLQVMTFPQNWFQKAALFVITNFKKINIQQTWFQNEKSNLESIIAKNSQQIDLEQNQEQHQSQDQSQQSQNQSQQSQNNFVFQDELNIQAIDGCQEIQIQNVKYTFKNGQFNYLNFFKMQNKVFICNFCQKIKEINCLFCKCMQFNKKDLFREMKTKRQSQIHIQMPVKYIQQDNQNFNQIRFLIHARNLYYTTVNVQKKAFYFKFAKEIAQIKLKYFDDYCQGKYFPPLKLKQLGNQSFGANFGLFATEKIQKQIFIAEYAGDIISIAQQRFVKRKDMIFDLGQDRQSKYVIAPLQHIGYAALINQSQQPNCKSVLAIVKGKLRVIIYSIRTIQIGEQLFYNYKRLQQHSSFLQKNSQQVKYDGLLIKNSHNLCYLISSLQLIYKIRQYIDLNAIQDREIAAIFNNDNNQQIQTIFNKLNLYLKFQKNQQNDSSEVIAKLVNRLQRHMKAMVFVYQTMLQCCQCSIKTIKRTHVLSIPLKHNQFNSYLTNQSIPRQCPFCQFPTTKIIQKISIPSNNKILIFTVDTIKSFKIQKQISVENTKYKLIFGIFRKGFDSKEGHYYCYDFTCDLKINCDQISKDSKIDQPRCLVYQSEKQYVRQKFNYLQQIPTIILQSFQKFILLIPKIEKYFDEIGAIKIKLLQTKTIQYKLDQIKVKSQSINKISNSVYRYSNIKEKIMTFQDYKQINQKQKYQKDSEYWQNIQNGQVRLYSPDNIFKAYRFHTIFDQIVKQDIIGINSPFLFIGSKGSTFGIHSEDYNTQAINIQLQGQKKIWYIVHKAQRQLIEKQIQSQIQCKKPFIHKDFIINPYLFNKVRISKIEQQPQQIVFVFSKTLHWGYNMGFNVNYAYNIGSQEWLKYFEQFSSCECNIVPRLSKKKLLKNLRQYFQRRNDNKNVQDTISSIVTSLENKNVLE